MIFARIENKRSRRPDGISASPGGAAMPLIEQVSIDKQELERLRRCTNLLIRVWADWRDSGNANDPDADGFELLNEIRKELKP